MKKNIYIFLFIYLLIFSGCSVKSAIKNTIETAYKTAVDERPIRHIINDKKLTGLMMAEILEDDLTNLLDISAKCYFGYPFVVGECNTLDEAERVVEIAKKVTGKPVIPYLLKKDADEKCNPAYDLKITAEITARLVADKKIFATNIYVKSVQCQAILLGVAGSKEAIKVIIHHAKSAEGVKEVHSFLVETGTGRSWESVFESIAEMVPKSEEKILSPPQEK